MGGITRALFGGSKSKNSSQASSSNRAWDMLKDPLSGMLGGGVNAFNSLAGILGGGFDDYKKNAGFDFQLNKGTRDISGSAASRGLLNSGATAKALAKYETDLGSTMYNNWLDRLAGAAGLGLQGGNTLVGAGQQSTSSSVGKGTSSGNGILGTLFG
jgi:hypothetical protein